MFNLLPHATRPSAAPPPSPTPLPVAMEVVLEEPVTRAQHLVQGVRRIKETPWYRLIRRRGLRFVPLGHREGAIVLVVGTAASLGAAYLAYRRLKHGHRSPPAASPPASPSPKPPTPA